ncbi:hypothetical protein LZ575_08275 [Antarcticibacterium sp. 1MA-6-2]|uniref:DUF6660 family protein n=1 Tax=Antarcticibacterium sp. 1MA-6-2 TaxID=2908210 RepID=UPI001F22C8A2|nr:DUF6660 family protein [Antarcticibacterium sp. 1MA-6-2]UJH92475.1 hypothetical protein LZ575_08275 [Antarcticibacterium sp. 1MA-6-2]
MKFLALIMSFLVLFLNSVTCCILDECAEETAVENQDHEEKEACENCSPFINCGTCTGFLLVFESSQFSSEVIETNEEFYKLQDLSNSRYVPAIWQPPQIV